MALSSGVPIVRLDIWGIPRRSAVQALTFAASTQRQLKGSGALFGKTVGTGLGVPLSALNADLGHWVMVTTWPDQSAALEFADHRCHEWSRDIRDEHFFIVLQPMASKGTWGGEAVFGDPVDDLRDDEPVATITRGRVRLRHWQEFRKTIVPLADELAAAPGMAMRVGLTEAPVCTQGTFSVWSSAQAMNDFAYRHRAHQEVMQATVQHDWYSESLFARFRVLDYGGVFGGISWSS